MARAKVLAANGAPRWVVGQAGEVVKTYEDGWFSAEACRSTHFRTWSFERDQVEILTDEA